MVIGLLIHAYRFTNTLLNHDALYNVYSSQNMTDTGRWFLSIACALSSYFDLPWLIGVFSIGLIALTAVVITDLFEMENPILIGLCGALLVSFPAITETFFFEFTADGYMMAMLFAALSVRLTVIGENRPLRWAAAGVLLCLSAAIYQAYVSFAMVLTLACFMVDLLEGRHSTRAYMRWIRNELALYVAAMAGYYVIWKLCMRLSGWTDAAYMGIDQLGKGSLYDAVYNVLWSFALYFLEWDITTGWKGLTVHNGLHMLFLLAVVLVAALAVRRSRLYARKTHFVLFLLAAAAIPFSAYLWYFASPGVVYCTRMEQSLCLCFVLTAALYERWADTRVSTLAGLLLAAIVLNNSVTANVFYHYMDRCNRQSYATAVEMSTRIHALDDGTITRIAIGGGLDPWEAEDETDPSGLGTLGRLKSVRKNLFENQTYISLYMAYALDFTLSYYRAHPDADMPVKTKEFTEPVPADWSFAFPAVSSQELREIRESQAYRAMPCWPAADSVQVMGDVIVLKLSE